MPSADQGAGAYADFSFPDLVQAYFDCRENKRNTASALAFEERLEYNLAELDEELRCGSYRPGRSICFVVTRPKPREVWAADFRDRIVHHLLYNRICARFYAGFIADSCACIPGRGTLYAARRLEAKIRSATENWSKPCHYLKCDIANFFVSIPKKVVARQLAQRIDHPYWRWLANVILFHDPRPDVDLRGTPAMLKLIPPHKSLFNQDADFGLPIGNLSSQFFANVFMDELDQYVKHQVRARHYIRYVDDFVLLHESTTWLNDALRDIAALLPDRLGVKLNNSKTILQPVDRGVDFVGHVIKPWRRTTRKRTMNVALQHIEQIDVGNLIETANSYFGLLRQAGASHDDRSVLAKAIRMRGHSVDRGFTKAFR